MANFVTIKMETAVNLAAAVAVLPASDVWSKTGPIVKISLSDLGLRSIRGGDYSRHTKTGQALNMSPWDGVTGVINATDILSGLTPAGTNYGRIKFLLTDQIQKSIQYGVIKEHVDRGFLVVEGYVSDASIDPAGIAYVPTTPVDWQVVPADVQAALDQSAIYVPTNLADWVAPPTTGWEALDRIAVQVAILMGAPIP